ncbi:hypothetical protein WICPIJ_006295 [Wickerhamomyces pijperi]|nr:hypothetical protein WICPIJ_006295 [Wickerhamomyces pijperi]
MFVFRVWSGIFRNRDQQRTFLDDPHIVVDIQLPGMNDVELHGKQRQREAFGEEFKQLKSVLLSLADHHVTA